MNLKIPKYNLNFRSPIVGYGNFSYKKQSESERPMVNPDICDMKFKLWQYVLENGLLTSNDEYTRVKAFSLLKDKTIFSYHYFKLNNAPLKLRYYQDCILSDDYDRILFIGSNQLGKSVTLDDDASTEFIKDHKHEWRGLLVSNSLTQSKERMSNIRQLLDSSGIVYKTEDFSEKDKKSGKQISLTVITYTFRHSDGTPLYTNKLICCPHTSSALGYPVNGFWWDEIEFWEDVKGGTMHWVKQVGIPRTFDTHGFIKVYSNPVEGGVMQSLMNERDIKGDLLWHVYRFNYWDRIDSTQEFFDRQIIGMTKAEIASTLLGDFARAEGAFLSKDEIDDQYDETLNDNSGLEKPTWWFLDVGEVHDQCCLIGGYIEDNPDSKAEMYPLAKAFWIHKYPVGYPIARVVGAESEFTQDDGWEHESKDNPSVKDILTDYAEEVNNKLFLPPFGVDVTNNKAIIPLFNMVGIEPEELKFEGRNKWDMYQKYQTYTQQRWFKRAKDRDINAIMSKEGVFSDFQYQASKLRIKKRSETKTRYGQIHHENENDLDDTQDSCVGFLWMIENFDAPSGRFDIINNGTSQLNPIEDEKQEIKELKQEHPELDGQYIPSFYNANDLDDWLSNKEKHKR